MRCFGDLVESRRNHSSCELWKFLFILGGIDAYGNVLSDAHMLNLDTLKWTTLKITNPLDFSFAPAEPVFRGEIRFENVYMPYHTKLSKNIITVKEEGIYVFGGKNS